MKRTLLSLALLVFVCSAGRLAAQEPLDSELDFVRKLRAKGYADLAKEYLDKVAARKDPKLAPILPLEEAKNLLAMARDKSPEQRFGMFAQARKLLQQYVAKNAGKPGAAEASLEIANLSSAEGQALLTKALREMEPPDQHKLARPAEVKFKQAAKDLDAAIKVAEAVAASPGLPPDAKQKLQKDLVKARFERGAILLDQARTYLDTAKEQVNADRAKIVEEARKIFVKLGDEEEDPAVTYLANAWLMKIAMEQQAPTDVAKYYNRVITSKEPEAATAKRWARLFQMQDVLTGQNNVKVKEYKIKTPQQKYDLIQKEGLAWLKDYPAYVKATEGQGVLWELAQSYYLEAKALDAKKDAKKIDAALEKAQKYYGQLATIDGDYSEKANQINLAISFERMGDRKDFRTFDDFYLKAQYEMLKMRQAGARKGDAKGADRAEKEWKGHLKEVIKALNRAISLSTPRTPVQKLDDARYYLTSAYLISGDLYRAAVAGEALGRTRPPTRRAPAGAGYAIDAYGTLLARDKDEATRAKLLDLIQYVLLPENQKFWSGEPVTGVAHYQQAMLYERDNNFKAAIAELQKLTPDFPGYIYAQGQLVFIAQQARGAMNASDAEKKDYEQAARAALARMPDLPSDADPSTTAMYFFAKLELPKFIYAEGFQKMNAKDLKAAAAKFAEMDKQLAELDAKWDKVPVKLTKDTRDRIDLQLGALRKYANLGRAEVQFREGQYDKVLEFVKPTTDAVAKLDKDKKAPIRLKDFQVTGDVIGLALRAEVQKGDVAAAKTLLGRLKRLRGTEDGIGADDASAAVIRNLLGDIAGQVQTLKKENDKAKLAATVEKFGTFLDELTKDFDPKTKKIPPDELRLLANAFASLDQYKKAADLYAGVVPPKVLTAKKIEEMTPDEQKEVAEYWIVQLDRAKALRRAKETEASIKLIDESLKHPAAMFHIYFDMEKTLNIEDEGKYGAALRRWNSFLKNPSLLKQLNNPRMKELYFEGFFYQVRSMYNYAEHDPAAKSKDKIVALSAKQILKLENTTGGEGWSYVGSRFRELLNAEPKLKAEYDRQKGAATPAPAGGK
jgi:hypothetical protein